DVHPNPGPSSTSSTLSSVPVSSILGLNDSGLSVMHLNIMSILPKLDILQIESQYYDILIFTETWLRDYTDNNDILIHNVDPPFEKTVYADKVVVLQIYVRSVLGLKALCVDLSIQHRTLLVGGFYRPLNSNNNWSLLEESIDHAFTHNSNTKLIARSFNVNI
ncbi:LOW QUALITY PROTEIN: hypothetical protein MAR_035609, partial [Mya arenaria]